MGKTGVFVILFVAVFTLALQPTLVNYSFAGVATETICDDGIDNDMDTLIDLDDPDCHVIILKPVPGALPELPGFPTDSTPLLGDFKCYDAFAPPPNAPVGLKDQFLPVDDRVLEGIEVCNWIHKLSGSGPNEEDFPPSIDPTFPLEHYKVYRLANNEPINEDILLKDQWGTTRHTQLTPVELWVPQTKLHSGACTPDSEFNPDTGQCETIPPCPSPGTFNPASGTCQFDYCTESTIGSIFGPYDPGTDTCGGVIPIQCNAEFPPYNNILPPPSGTCEFIPPIVDVPPVPGWFFPQQTDIHWKCYDVEPKRPDNRFLVDTIDRNFNEMPVPSDVIHLDKICAPVEKTVRGCPEGYIRDDDLCFNSLGDSIPFVRTFGDSTIDDHLTCYDIEPRYEPVFPYFNGDNDDVTYVGQFQSDTYTITMERELCLFATKVHVPEDGTGGPVIGGTFIPIDSSAMLLLAAQTTFSWLIPVLVSAAGIGIVLARKISSKKE